MSLDKASPVGDIAAFSLSEKKRKYIVSVIQNQISELSQIKSFLCSEDAIANHKRILELLGVVEAFRVEKVWSKQGNSSITEN